jgi:hypothetical protein
MWVSVGKPEGKGPLEKNGSRWEYNIKMYLSEISWSVVDWIYLAQDRDQ